MMPFPSPTFVGLLVAAMLVILMMIAGDIPEFNQTNKEQAEWLKSAQEVQRLHGGGLHEQGVIGRYIYGDTLKREDIITIKGEKL